MPIHAPSIPTSSPFSKSRHRLGAAASTALGILRLWRSRPRLSKRGVIGLAWAFLPRKLKLAAAGALAVVLIVLAGAIAALVLVLEQLG